MAAFLFLQMTDAHIVLANSLDVFDHVLPLVLPSFDVVDGGAALKSFEHLFVFTHDSFDFLTSRHPVQRKVPISLFC